MRGIVGEAGHSQPKIRGWWIGTCRSASIFLFEIDLSPKIFRCVKGNFSALSISGIADLAGEGEDQLRTAVEQAVGTRFHNKIWPNMIVGFEEMTKGRRRKILQKYQNFVIFHLVEYQARKGVVDSLG